jgi:hypothetical protein
MKMVFPNHLPTSFRSTGAFIHLPFFTFNFSSYYYIPKSFLAMTEEMIATKPVHYYPFGMLIPSLSASNTLGALKDNRYLYNGKEFNDDFDLNWYVYPVFIGNYGVKFYDAQIARFHFAERKLASLSSLRSVVIPP